VAHRTGAGRASLFGIPDMQAQETRFDIKVPYVLGLIATRSLTGEVTGINELVLRADQRIHSGLIAYDAVEKLKADRNDIAARATFEAQGRSRLCPAAQAASGRSAPGE
jgi:cytochrome d ubiquinol oxidase subunit I